jgi:carbon-monoxide dehydrogenase small subunit
MSEPRSTPDAHEHAVDVVIDGTSCRLEATPTTSLLRAMRDAGLTQVMGACEQGECGSCSVLLDGRLECACLVPALVCDGARVDTAASLVDDSLASALAQRGAVQCGFCTPGFVVAAAALTRADPPARSRDDVREALAGNLCRCTGYEAIVDAVHEVATRGLVVAPSRTDRGDTR